MNATKRWHDLIAVDTLEKGDVTPAKLGTVSLAVYDAVDGIFVSLARCTHGGANLCDGYFDGRFIECPLHQGLFDVQSGRALAAPATRPLRIIETRIKNGFVQVFM